MNGAAAAAALAVLVQLPFAGKAVHMDEPVFLNTAEHVLVEPGRPGNFPFNWYGTAEPMRRINNNPPGIAFLLAGLKALGVTEIKSLRLAMLPFDAIAAAALFLLASRFLARPLLPVLAVVASPAWVVNFTHLQPEKPAVAFAVAGLYFAVAFGEGDRKGYLLSIILLAVSTLFKFGAVVFLLPAVCFLYHRGVPLRTTVRFLALSLLPLMALAAYDAARGMEGGPAVAAVLSQGSSQWRALAYKLRAFFCFLGGCAPAVFAWSWGAPGKRVRRLWFAIAAGAALLAAGLDIEPVRGVDRLTGWFFAASGLAALAAAAEPGARNLKGWPLWAPWIVGAAALQVGFYWSVLARIVLFLIPPLVFLLAELHESEGGIGEPAMRLTVLASLVLSLSLGAVDFRYASAQRRTAEELGARYLSAGRTVWFNGHWGLQHYLSRAGARQIDEAAGGLEAVRPGDMLLVSRVNSNNSLLGRPRLKKNHRVSEDYRRRVDSAVPLRLMSGWTGQGGFYADSWGFLPYSPSREPVDEFVAGELE